MRMNDKDFIQLEKFKTNERNGVVTYDGKIVIVPFNELFNKPIPDEMNRFLIKKNSYVNSIDIISDTINYFLKYYDTEHEIITAYLKLRYLSSNKDKNIKKEEFISYVYAYLFTDSIISKIKQLVDDNYELDIDNDPLSAKFSDESRWTDEHSKILYRITIGIRLLIAPVFHYLNTKNLMSPDNIYIFYEKLLDIMSEQDINIYNKLWIMIHNRCQSSVKNHPTLWGDREIYSETVTTRAITLLRRNLIVDSVWKFSFNKNIIKLINVILRDQLKYTGKIKYSHNLISINEEDIKSANDSELSRVDKLMMNAAKIDETIIVISSLNIKRVIDNIQREMQIEITEDEIQFYTKYYKINKNQVEIVNYFYAKMFNGFLDLSLLTKRQYLTLVILLKRRFLIMNMKYIAQLITGNAVGRIISRPISNQKILESLNNTPMYTEICENKFNLVKKLNNSDSEYSKILSLMSSLISTKYTLLDYSSPELMDKEIIIDHTVLREEFLNLLNII